jgi:PAS domain S-box-containing protein
MPTSIKDKVRALEKQNRLLTENLVDAIWVIDAETLTYAYITPSIERISGYTSAELIHTSIVERLTPESLKEATDLLAAELKAYEKGQRIARSVELELIHKDSGTYWVGIRAKFLKEADNPLKIGGITRDITVRKKSRQALEKLNRKLTAALADKQALLEKLKVLQRTASHLQRLQKNSGHGRKMVAHGSVRAGTHGFRFYPHPLSGL